MDTNDLRKAGIAVFLATTEEVARELSNKLKEAADEIDRLREQVVSHQAYRTDEFCICGSQHMPRSRIKHYCGRCNKKIRP